VTSAEYIDRNIPSMAGCLRRLVRIPTVNPPGEHYDAMTAALTGELQALGLKTRRYRIPGSPEGYPRFNVLGRLPSRGAKKTIHFNAHYDVVPVSGAWRHGSPFSGAVEGGWMLGRGTADMKGSIASLLAALRAVKVSGTRPLMNVEVSFTADEETDSVLGAEWLVRNAPLEADCAIVMEGGEGRSIGCGHNGVVWLEVTVHGKAAHGSRPEAGVNALEKMSALVLALEAYKKAIARTRFTGPGGIVMHPTLNTGGVFGCGAGAKVNTVPASASFTLDRRVLPNEDHEAAEKGLREFLADAARRIPGCRITVAKISENFACFRPPADPFFAALGASLKRVRRTLPTFGVSTGFNDMHFFAHRLGIPTAGYGPGGTREHALDERAKLGDLAATAKIYADLLTSFAG
jgi:succinyl-diaminopimelate desuccinylase